MRSNFRGTSEWKQEGLPLTTTSNEAAKLYDAAITQYIGWYTDANFGGLVNTLDGMLKADPEFVIGHCLKLGIDFVGAERSIRTDSSFKDDFRKLEELVNKNQNLTRRELKHVDALIKYSNGDYEKAFLVLESILFEYPTDTHALKLISDLYFIFGRKPELRDVVAKVVPYYQDKNNAHPLTGYVLGMHAFALEENALFDLSIKQANQAMELTPEDGWAHHAIGHCYEMLGKTKEGIQHYEVRQRDWTKADNLISHNWWHYGVYHIERNEFEKALKIFEDNCLPICLNDGNIFNIVDSASFLYRLRLIDQENPVSLWQKMHKNAVEPHLNDHVLGFNEVHFMMSCLGSKRYDQAEQLIEQLDKEDPVYPITSTILEAMYNHERGNHEKAVDLLLPIKYKIIQIGGSDAQRDVVSQLLVMSTIKSSNAEHKKLANSLIIERDQLKTVSPLNSLMRQKLEN